MGNGKRILLAEDDRFLRRACEACFRQRGFTVVTAVDGEEALRLARAEAPDFIALDLLMPKLTGIEVLRALRADAQTQAIPVLVLSNSSREQDMQEAKALGVVGYFVKANLSLQELGHWVERYLGGNNHDERHAENSAR